MAKTSEIAIGIPKEMVQSLDKFLQTKQCKNLGVTSRRQLVIMILRQWIGSTDGFGIKSLKTIDTIPKDKFITENDFEETINKIIRSNDYLKKEHTDINKKIEDIVRDITKLKKLK